jgi:outer membrane protein OmpA-like peptidoglycan-associated protein
LGRSWITQRHMTRLSAVAFILFSALFAGSASAEERLLTCDYQLGSDTEASRRKVGSVFIAIDVDARTAKVDFGKGWFRKMKLLVDGTDARETSPPSSGKDLGFFFFDLAANGGGFSGGSNTHEFFDACVPTTEADKIKIAQRDAVQSAKATPAQDAPRALASPNPPASPPENRETTTRRLAETAPPKAALQAPSPAPGAAERSKAPDASIPPPPVAAPVERERTEAQGSTKAPQAPTIPPADGAPVRLDPTPAAPSGSAEIASAAPIEHGTTQFFGANAPRKQMPPASVAVAVADTAQPLASKSGAPTPTPAPAAEAEHNLATEHGTTQYFGSTKIAEASAGPRPPVQPVQAAALDACHETLAAELHRTNVNFPNASFILSDSSRAQLRKIASIAKGCENLALEVGGHTDNMGAAEENRILSQRRADAVADVLVRAGFPASNLKAIGYGQAQPIATNATVVGRRTNRRVEFRISGSRAPG